MRKNLKELALTLLSLDLATIIITLCLGSLDFSVVLGLGVGTFVAIFYFFWLAVSAYKAVEKPQGDAKRYMQKTYIFRYFFFALSFLLVVQTKFASWWAFLIPVAGLKVYFFLVYNLVNRKEG